MYTFKTNTKAFKVCSFYEREYYLKHSFWKVLQTQPYTQPLREGSTDSTSTRCCYVNLTFKEWTLMKRFWTGVKIRLLKVEMGFDCTFMHLFVQFFFRVSAGLEWLGVLFSFSTQFEALKYEQVCEQ